MGEFWKILGAVLLSVVLSLAVGKQDIALVLSVFVCCVTACAALSYLEPVLDFFRELQEVCNFPSGLLAILLKAVGIALVTELSATVCLDAGRGSMGKILQFLGSAVVLSLSIPVFRELLTMIREMVGQL